MSKPNPPHSPEALEAARHYAHDIATKAMEKAIKVASQQLLATQPKPAPAKSAPAPAPALKKNPALARAIASGKGSGGTKEFKPNELKAMKDKKYGLQSKLHHERVVRKANESKAEFVKRVQGKKVETKRKSSLGGSGGK
jgi:hypothetical protein